MRTTNLNIACPQVSDQQWFLLDNEGVLPTTADAGVNDKMRSLKLIEASRVQKKLKHNGLSGGVMNRNKRGALLRWILRDAAKTPNHTTKGKKRYRCYICAAAQKNGWSTCESKSIPAQQIEDSSWSRFDRLSFHRNF